MKYSFILFTPRGNILMGDLGRVEKDLSRFSGAADMSDRWDDAGDDYDV